MTHNLLIYSILLFFVALLTGCEKDEEAFTPKYYQVVGKVEKGPFINGSTITAQALDKDYNLIGEVYQGTITDDDGSFDLGEIRLNSPYVLLTASGYYFNEVIGNLSLGQIAMQSLVNLSDNKQVNVNLLTHLKTQRMMQLLKSNHSVFDEADQQVQKEVLRNFDLEQYASKDVCDFSIASGTNEAGALIVISSALLVNRSDAQLTEYLAKLSAEFKVSGTFAEKTKKQFKEDVMMLDMTKISDNIVKRYDELGMSVTVPNLNLFVDWDGDGIAGNEPDAGEGVILTLDKTELLLPAEGGTFRIKIQCKVPVTIQKPDWAGDESVSEDFLKIFKYADINHTKSIEGDELVVVAQAADGALMSETAVTVYTTVGKIAARLKVMQQGNPAKKVEFTSDGETAISSIGMRMLTSMQDFCNLDGYYTQSFDANATAYRSIYNHTLNSSDSKIKTIWANAYTSIASINTVNKAFAKEADVSSVQSYIRQLVAAQYFQLASWWENVPYVTNYDDPFADFKQLGSAALFANFIEDVEYCAEQSKPELEQLSPAEAILYPAQGASLALLAKMHLHQKSYAQAYDCLKQIIRSDVYVLSDSIGGSCAVNSKELVWGLRIGSQQELPENVLKGNAYVPFVVYTEVLLSAAECAYRLGNQADAQAYLNKVTTARGLPLLSGMNFMENLRSVWQSQLRGFGSYFAFLRRNGLAVEQLKIQNHQQLLPIPGHDISTSPGLVQNPGW